MAIMGPDPDNYVLYAKFTNLAPLCGGLFLVHSYNNIIKAVVFTPCGQSQSRHRFSALTLANEQRIHQIDQVPGSLDGQCVDSGVINLNNVP